MAEAGSGQCKYDLNEDWGKLPSGSSWGRVTGVAVDSQERVYVCQQLKDPPILVFDKDGNYYVADQGNHLIRKIDTNGVITTVAGNGTKGYYGSDTTATHAPLNNPRAVAVDSKYNLYISFKYRYVNCNCSDFLGFICFFYFRLVSKFYTY